MHARVRFFRGTKSLMEKKCQLSHLGQKEKLKLIDKPFKKNPLSSLAKAEESFLL